MSIAIGQDGKPQLCVGRLPGRSRPSLYLWTALEITPLASFKSEWAAEEAVKFFDSMIGARVVDGVPRPPPRARRTAMLEYRAWVIDTGEGGCIGRYWYGIVPPPHMEGHRYAAWDTRAEARAELPMVKGSFPKARVRRAAITVHMESQEER